MAEIHDLTAGYALDALDADEERAYEEHLATCERCRDELAELQPAASALAFGVEAADPPSGLRERILERAAAERTNNVVPFRRRRTTVVASAFGAVAAAAAVVVGIWATSLWRELAREREALEILADPQAKPVPLRGANGRLVVASTRDAALVLSGVGRAPEGKTYEVWVIAGGKPVPAGLFKGELGRTVVRLRTPVPSGATVAVTIEREGGFDALTTPPLFSDEA